VPRDQTAVISQDEDASMNTPAARHLSSNSSVYYNASGHCRAPNSTELSTEPNNCSVTQIPNILRNIKIQYRVHKILPLVPIQNQADIVYILHSHCFTVPRLSLGLPNGLHPSGCPIKISYVIHSHACYMPCASHLPWSEHLTIFDEQYKLRTPYAIFCLLLLHHS
jgi:hypothetical protein